MVGDDFFVTNTSPGIAEALNHKLAQIGTLTETFDAIEMAKAGTLYHTVQVRN